VPFVFVFSPALLIVTKGFTWTDFFITLTGCIIGLTLLSAAFSKYMFTDMHTWQRWLCAIAALLFIAPGYQSGLIGLAIAAPAVLSQWFGRHQRLTPNMV
jgi:TRAP-type uncharacterized transport system fused permease subunit